tara:strand:- start:3215 stop:3490 length:276 start_codon:yes stop_codon:yes gene_type:complete
MEINKMFSHQWKILEKRQNEIFYKCICSDEIGNYANDLGWITLSKQIDLQASDTVLLNNVWSRLSKNSVEEELQSKLQNYLDLTEGTDNDH